MHASRIIVPAVTLLAAGSSLGVEILTNRGFENANHSLNWTVNAPINVKEYPASFWSPGPVPTGNGPWGLEIVQNGGTSGSFLQTNAQQIVTMPPGQYEVKASVWARVYDTQGSAFSRARFRLLVDGVQQEQLDLVGDTVNGGWTPWTKLETATHTVNVTTSLGVFLQMRADGTGSASNWGQVVADVFSLDATLIPEPTALLLLGAALPLALRGRRRA